MVISWLLLITIAAAVFSIYDGVRRLRGHHSNSILAIAELVFAVLMLVSVFVAFPGAAQHISLRARPRGRADPDSRAQGHPHARIHDPHVDRTVLNSIVVLIAAGWLHIPGLG